MNLEPETRRGYYITAEMKKVWAVEIKLLKKLLKVCEKHNLRIFAEGGTLLGAVREHGFIPWDDDIDMAMPREDYDKMREIASDEFKAPFFFQCGYTDLFPNGFTRLRMDGTAAIFKKSIYHNCHQGIFIDIFPLDAVPTDFDEFNKLLIKRMEMKEKMILYSRNHFSFTNLLYDWKAFVAKIEIGKIGFHRYFNKYDLMVKQYSKKPYSLVSIFSWNYDNRYLRESKWYNDTIFIPFEDIMIPVPTDYEKILTTQFGDYMRPVKAPSEHGGFLILDAQRSYNDYLPSLRKEHKWDSWKYKFHHLINLFR